MIEWNSKIEASSDNGKINLKGVLIDSTVNENKWQILAEDLPDIAAQSVGTQLRLDHSDNVRDVKGQILSTFLDEPHSEAKAEWDPPNKYPHIHFDAELITDDNDVLIPILNGYVDHVSIGADAENVYCAQCGKPSKPIKHCKCNSHDILKGIAVKEYSIITNPAYKNAVFVPFKAAIDKFLEENMEEEKEGVTGTNITNNFYYNSTNPGHKVLESSTSITASETHSVNIIPEERADTPVIAAVDAPDEFEVNVTKDTIKSPKENNMEKETELPKPEYDAEDEVKKPVEASAEHTASDVAELIASVRSLVAALTDLKDEDKEKVEASDGYITKDHDTAKGNPPNPKGTPPAPVSPNTESGKAPRTDAIPPEGRTPSMHASGMSAGLIGDVSSPDSVEMRSLKEIFAYAAKDGVRPMRG